jgi:DNA mismatch repair protein MutS
MGELTPMMRQYHEAKARYPDAVLFFHLGDFYETFFEDAEIVARELDIVLTKRDGHPMAGVPVRKAEVYIQRLLKKGYKVALCDQLERPAPGKKLLKRGVVRVLTPGTVLAEEGLEAEADAFLLAVYPQGERVGLAWCEAASGEFWATEVNRGELEQVVSRLGVREVLLPEGMEAPSPLPGVRTVLPTARFTKDPLHERFGDIPLIGEMPLAARAAGAILAYLCDTLYSVDHLSPPTPWALVDAMELDSFTQRGLELVVPLRPESRLTLLSVLDRTVTPMGKRLLRRWLLHPLRDRRAIEDRLDAVEVLTSAWELEELGEALRGACDLPRLLGRLGVGRANPLDLALLRRTFRTLPRAVEVLRALPARSPLLESCLRALEEAPMGITDEIERFLVDSPPPSPEGGGLVREGYSVELDALRARAAELREEIASLERKERERTGIPTLRVSYNQVLGYFFELTKTHLPKVPPDWRRRQTLKGVERFTSAALEALADELAQVEARAAELERELYEALLARIREEIPRLRRLGEALAELDVLRSLAEVAQKGNWRRPRFVDVPRITIREGRHPVVEWTRDFVPNDLVMDEKTKLAVVTGPNMAGKSVFLRQVALIALLAQMGSFVPAKEVELPLFDKIYTRVGATDALSGGLSTFMAEMREAVTILSGATERSLVILDELGRGTSTYDGMALAWAIAKYLVERVECKTLFATHYRELTRLAEEVPGVMNLHAAVREWRGEVIFLHRVLPGAAERSYGVQVAKLAEIPDEVLREAERILALLEREELHRGKRMEEVKAAQLPLFPVEDHPLMEELRKLEPERLTPLEALELIFRWKERWGG